MRERSGSASPQRRRALLCAMALLLGTACSRPPADPAPLRPVLDRAVSRLRASRPEAAASVEELRQRAETASAVAAAAPWWRSHPESATGAWERAVAEAARQTMMLESDTLAAQQRWQASLATARDGVSKAQTKLRSAGIGREEAAAVSRAKALLAAARRLAAAGSFDAAADAADRAADAVLLVEERWQEEHRRFADPRQRLAWQRLAEEAVSWSARTRSAAIVVDKVGRRLLLYQGGTLKLTLPAELGINGLRRKRHAGDRATPEGRYRVTVMKQGAATRFSKALLIDYPNSEDLRRFRVDQADGKVPRGVGPGGLIEIHGGGGNGGDWTDGCVALSDADMDLIFARVSVGTPVIIVGSLDTTPAGAG